MAPKLRKQRVALRFRRREEIKRHVRKALARSIVLGLLIGLGAGLFAHRDSVFFKFLHRHTPQAVIKTPDMLIGLPVQALLPRERFWLWAPGAAWWLEWKLTHRYSAVQRVYLSPLDFGTSRNHRRGALIT